MSDALIRITIALTSSDSITYTTPESDYIVREA